MMKRSIIHLVDFAIQRPWWTIIVALLLAATSGVYAVRHFAIKTDTKALISRNLPWAQRATRYANDFPQRGILVVLDAPTPEIADQTAAELTMALQQRPDRFRAVSQLGGGSFFEQNGLLFLPTDQVARISGNSVKPKFSSGHWRPIPASGALSMHCRSA